MCPFDRREAVLLTYRSLTSDCASVTLIVAAAYKHVRYTQMKAIASFL